METETNVDGVTSLHVYYEYYPSKNKSIVLHGHTS